MLGITAYTGVPARADSCSVTVKIETVSVPVLNGELPQSPGLLLQWFHDLRT
jgi:hypothetical protein